MPVQTTRSNRSVVLAVLGLVLGIVAVLALFVVAVPSLTEDGKVQVKLGDDRFPAGPAESRAASIAADGPILFPDLAGGQRSIYLQHLGDDPLEGWYAFDARRPGQPRECTLAWDAARAAFVDPCDGTEVAADGAGLPGYPVVVEDGQVVVDLNAAQRSEREVPAADGGTSTSSSILVTGGDAG